MDFVLLRAALCRSNANGLEKNILRKGRVELARLAGQELLF